MSKTILVTGSSGFTGRYVVNEFKKAGYNVIGLVNESPSTGEMVCDLRDKQKVVNTIGAIRPDGIIHLAALSFVGHPNPEDFYSVNVLGTENIISALIINNICPHKIIIASSANVYGNPDVLGSINENCPPSPVNHYAISKLAMEFMARMWFERLPIIIARPFNYTGPGQDPKFLIPKIVAAYKRQDTSIPLGNIDVYRDFSDVRDVAKVYLKLFESNAKSEVVNICSGEAYSLLQILNLTSEIAGYEIEVKINPEFVRPNEIKQLFGDNSRLLSITGFRPSTPLKKTLLDMYNS
jgi:Nucleoside-diphosphate-sugar epimerases